MENKDEASLKLPTISVLIGTSIWPTFLEKSPNDQEEKFTNKFHPGVQIKELELKLLQPYSPSQNGCVWPEEGIVKTLTELAQARLLPQNVPTILGPEAINHCNLYL